MQEEVIFLADTEQYRNIHASILRRGLVEKDAIYRFSSLGELTEATEYFGTAVVVMPLLWINQVIDYSLFTNYSNLRVVLILPDHKGENQDRVLDILEHGIHDIIYREDAATKNIAALIEHGRTYDAAIEYSGIVSVTPAAITPPAEPSEPVSQFGTVEISPNELQEQSSEEAVHKKAKCKRLSGNLILCVVCIVLTLALVFCLYRIYLYHNDLSERVTNLELEVTNE